MRQIILLSLILSTACSTFQKVAIRTTSPMMVQGSEFLTRERSWSFFQESTPGNLKFVEMLWMQDPSNFKMLSVLIKGYAGYAFGVAETLSLGDEWSGVENSLHKQSAIDFYTRSLDFGVLYLSSRGIKKEQLLSLEEKELMALMDHKLKQEDHVAVVFMAQAWGSLINLQKENITLVSSVPKVKTMFDWVCQQNPDIENGVCDIFYAQYESSRPRMLGGNPEKGRHLFVRAMEKHPKHLLIRLTYIQQVLLPAMDLEEYEKEALKLKNEFEKWGNLNRDNLADQSDYQKTEHLNLFNAIAKKRFELIEMNKKKIF